jgi:AraC-like DNA-binding protein
MRENEFVESYIEAWNRHDPKKVAGHLARDGVYFDMPTQRHLARDEFIDHLKNYFRLDNSFYKIVGEVLVAQHTIAFQYRASPRDQDDSESGWMGAEFVTLVGDTAVRIEDYYSDPKLSRPAEKNGQRYAKSGLSAAGLHAVTGRLNELMDGDRVYMDPQLSLPQLAATLGCSVNHLSQAINEGHGVSFFDFINGYRIREATSILQSEESTVRSILDVALEVGFNSTSTFYAAFKKATGQTPAQYRRQSVQD